MTEEIPVVLYPHEFLYSAMIGVTRQIDNLRGKRRDRYGATREEAWRMHIEGACGECAVARVLKTYWSGNLGNLQGHDVEDLEVRTRSREDADLIVHKEDRDTDPFVLVIGRAPRFRVVGWMYAGDAKQDRWWIDPAGDRPAFFVPRSELRPMSELLMIMGR